jgi:hypothetical protein
VVKRFFFLLNSAFAMAILDLISQVHLPWSVNMLLRYLKHFMEIKYKIVILNSLPHFRGMNTVNIPKRYLSSKAWRVTAGIEWSIACIA